MMGSNVDESASLFLSLFYAFLLPWIHGVPNPPWDDKKRLLGDQKFSLIDVSDGDDPHTFSRNIPGHEGVGSGATCRRRLAFFGSRDNYHGFLWFGRRWHFEVWTSQPWSLTPSQRLMRNFEEGFCWCCFLRPPQRFYGKAPAFYSVNECTPNRHSSLGTIFRSCFTPQKTVIIVLSLKCDPKNKWIHSLLNK